MLGGTAPGSGHLGPKIPGHRWAARPGLRRILGDLEAEVMEAIWAQPTGSGATMRQVFETLHRRDRRIGQSTVVAIMGRLARGELLRIELSRGLRLYHSVYTRDELVSHFLRLIRQRLPRRGSTGPAPPADAVAGREDLLSERAREALGGIARPSRTDSRD